MWRVLQPSIDNLNEVVRAGPEFGTGFCKAGADATLQVGERGTFLGAKFRDDWRENRVQAIRDNTEHREFSPEPRQDEVDEDINAGREFDPVPEQAFGSLAVVELPLELLSFRIQCGQLSVLAV